MGEEEEAVVHLRHSFPLFAILWICLDCSRLLATNSEVLFFNVYVKL
jgi:hypothetical protein